MPSSSHRTSITTTTTLSTASEDPLSLPPKPRPSQTHLHSSTTPSPTFSTTETYPHPSFTIVTSSTASVPTTFPSSALSAHKPHSPSSDVSHHSPWVSSPGSGVLHPTVTLPGPRPTVSTPDLWNALCSLVEQEGTHPSCSSDSSNRYDTPHDVDIVSWDRMDHLMTTHEYGACFTTSLSR